MQKKILSLFIVLFFTLLLTNTVFAFGNPDPLGVGIVDGETELSNEDPRRITIRITNVVLGFLGIITIIIIIVGGFKWMTSGGNPEKVGSAKKLLIAGLIGLGLVLLSWGIATFVIHQIGHATIGQYTEPPPDD